ncbi:CHAT domain-containing protein [Mycena vulgaris]|nr:CHAT domain-containing protein [Mycena vulgaris]
MALPANEKSGSAEAKETSGLSSKPPLGFPSLQDFEIQINENQKALDMTAEDDPSYPEKLARLGISLAVRLDRLSDLEGVQAAVDTLQKARTLIPEGHALVVPILRGLGASYGWRFQRLGGLEDLEHSIEKFEAIVNILSEEDPTLPPYLYNLSQSAMYRYGRLGNLEDLELAFNMAQKAITLTSDDMLISAVLLPWTATALVRRYDRLGDLQDLHLGIEKLQTSVHHISDKHPAKPAHLAVLGEAYGMRHIRLGDIHDVDSSIQYFRTAQKLLPEGNPHGSEWASLARDHGSNELLKAYKSMFTLLPATLWIGNSLSARQQEVTRFDIAQTTSDAVAACVEHGNLSLAIEFLDQGLATSFQHMLQLRPDLNSLPEAEATKLQDISTQLYTGKSPNSHQLTIERNKLLAEIRKRSGFEHFLLPRPYSALCKASGNGPIIILNSHKSHCDGIILLNHASEPLHVQLPDVTLVELEHQKNILKGLLSRCNVRSRDSDSTRLFAGFEGSRSKPVHESFQEMLTWLWKNVVGLIYQALENSNIVDGRVWWCPTGAFTGLPLHAAAPSDQFISSYTATIAVLLDAQALPESETPKLGVVGVTHSGKGQQAALPGVKKEIKVVSDLAGDHLSQSLVGEQATVEAVTSQLQTCEWVHLACHGKQDLRDPPKSCLQLYGGTLELETIMQMPLSKAEFVFLAACQTAMGDAQMVNESFHLGGGFIAAGFRSSIGTLWSMRDSDGPSVAGTVYTYLFRKDTTPKVTDTAKALQLAVRKLRDEGVPYQHWVPFIHMGI